VAPLATAAVGTLGEVALLAAAAVLQMADVAIAAVFQMADVAFAAAVLQFGAPLRCCSLAQVRIQRNACYATRPRQIRATEHKQLRPCACLRTYEWFILK
jgi:hypothetical protein